MSDKLYLTEIILLTKSYNLQDFKDWMHWHLDIIGFDHCHVFDNESSVNIKSVCDSYGDKVTYELVKGWPNQYALYNRYINNESKAWWVLPIDDDEFLYVSDKYKNNINEFLLESDFINSYHIRKLAIGWRNLYPTTYIEKRENSMIKNATAFNNEAVDNWQCGNRTIKTFLHTSCNYFFDKSCGHNPKSIYPALTINGEFIKANKQKSFTKSTDDLILYHYQYRSQIEWIAKCKLGSPANKSFNKNHPDFYKKLYSFPTWQDTKMLDLLNKKTLL